MGAFQNRNSYVCFEQKIKIQICWKFEISLIHKPKDTKWEGLRSESEQKELLKLRMAWEIIEPWKLIIKKRFDRN